MSVRAILAALAVLALSLTAGMGCGSSEAANPQSEVEGTVTIDGTAIANGSITFAEEDGDSVAADINDGKYTIALKPGVYSVGISAMEEYGEADETGVKMTREQIPAKYNWNSELKATVADDEPNTLDFDLKSR